MKKHPQSGFTLMELLLVMGLFAILSALTVVNLVRPQTQASLDSITRQLVSDLRAQQLLAMVGGGENGIRFNSNQYTLFDGNAYSPTNPNNFVVSTQSEVTLSTTFSNQDVIFRPVSGEVLNFTSGANTITVNDNSGGSKTITINRYGVTDIN